MAEKAVKIEKCKKYVKQVKSSLHPGRWGIRPMDYAALCEDGECKICYVDIIYTPYDPEMEDVEGSISFTEANLGRNVLISGDIPVTDWKRVSLIESNCDVAAVHEHDEIKHVHVKKCPLPDFLEVAKRL